MNVCVYILLRGDDYETRSRVHLTVSFVQTKSSRLLVVKKQIDIFYLFVCEDFEILIR